MTAATMSQELCQLSRQATAALHSGPFHHALDATIRDRGLTLEGLHRRLATHGVAVSLASLSYWRNGHRRPGRRSSLLVVRALEDILKLPPTSLLSLLGPPRTRGRGRLTLPPTGYEDAAAPAGRGDRAPASSVQWETGGGSELRLVSLHVDLWIGSDRRVLRQRVRCVLLAHRAGAHRHLYRFRPPHDTAPLLGPATGCRLGRALADPARSCLLVELIPDRPLAAGEMCVAEFGLRCPDATGPAGSFAQDVPAGVRELVIRVHYEPAALPVACWQSRRDLSGSTIATEVPLGHAPVASTVMLNPLPGRYTMGWQWPRRAGRTSGDHRGFPLVVPVPPHAHDAGRHVQIQ